MAAILHNFTSDSRLPTSSVTTASLARASGLERSESESFPTHTARAALQAHRHCIPKNTAAETGRYRALESEARLARLTGMRSIELYSKTAIA
jgi:hypothetical protein